MPTFKYYILDENHNVVTTNDVREWGRMFEDTSKRRVAWTDISEDISVSTVFLGIDHNFLGDGPPLLFETMVFGGKYNEYQQRYSTWDEAVKGHKKAVAMVRNAGRS